MEEARRQALKVRNSTLSKEKARQAAKQIVKDITGA